MRINYYRYLKTKKNILLFLSVLLAVRFEMIGYEFKTICFKKNHRHGSSIGEPGESQLMKIISIICYGNDTL